MTATRDPSQAILIRALRELITPGAYAASLESSPLIDIPIVIARAGPTAPEGVRARAFIEVLNEVVNKRLDRNDREAAAILFGLASWAGVPVRERHHRVARLRNKNWTWESNYRKEPLARDLLTVLLALEREAPASPELAVNAFGISRESPRPVLMTASFSARDLESWADDLDRVLIYLNRQDFRLATRVLQYWLLHVDNRPLDEQELSLKARTLVLYGGAQRDQGQIIGPLSAQRTFRAARIAYDRLENPRRSAQAELWLALMLEMSKQHEAALPAGR